MSAAASGSAARPSLLAAVASLLTLWLLLLSARLTQPWLELESAVLLSFAVSAAAALATAPAGGAAPRWRSLVIGGAAGFAALPAWVALVSGVGLAAGLAPRPASTPGAGGLGWWLATVVMAPVFEELVYRERLLSALCSRVGSAPALLLSSGVYALPHIDPWNVLGTWLVGLGLGLLWLAGRCVWLCVGFHAGLNLAIVTCGLPPGQPALGPWGAVLAGGSLLAVSLRDLRQRAVP